MLICFYFLILLNILTVVMIINEIEKENKMKKWILTSIIISSVIMYVITCEALTYKSNFKRLIEKGITAGFIIKEPIFKQTGFKYIVATPTYKFIEKENN